MITRLILGLILVVVSALFGFLLGAMDMFAVIVIPVTVMFESTCSPKTANEIMESLVNSDNPDGRKMARLFYIFYRMGYVLRHNEDAMEYHISAIEDSSGPLRLLRILEKRCQANVED